MRKILDAFRRRRFIDLGDEIALENGVGITIRPSIRSVTGDAWQTRIEEWIAATQARLAAEAQGQLPGSHAEEAAPIEAREQEIAE